MWRYCVPAKTGYIVTELWQDIANRQLDYMPKIIVSLQPSGHYMYRQFNIQQFYVLPTHCIYVFCVDLRTNSHYFPIQH